MKKTKIYTIEVPPVSHDFAKFLDTVFPKKEIKPGVTHDDLLYNAGERRVVDYIKRCASGSTISGNPEDIKKEEHNRSLLDKILGNRKQ